MKKNGAEVAIPMTAGVESLNVSVAAGVAQHVRASAGA